MAAGLPKVTAHDSLYPFLSAVRHPFDSLHTQEVTPRALTLEAFEWADDHPLRGTRTPTAPKLPSLLRRCSTGAGSTPAPDLRDTG